MEKISDFKMARKLLPFFRGLWSLVVLAVGLMIITQLVAVMVPVLVKVGIDRYILAGDLPGLRLLAGIMGVVLALNFAFQVAGNYSIELLGQRLLMNIRMALYRKVLYLSSDYFDTTATGSTITSITNDVEALRQFVSEGIITILGQILLLVLIVAAMFVINIKLALFTLISVPVFTFATALFRKSIRGGFRGVRKANAEINSHLVESINGIREIKLYNHQQLATDDFDRYNKNYLKSYLRVVLSYALFFPVMDWAIFLSMLAVLVYASRNLGKGVTAGEVTAFFLFVRQFFRPLKHLAENFNVFQSAMAAMERIVKLLSRESSIRVSSDPVPLESGLRGEIVFDRVSFCYREGEYILRDLSFTIHPGEKIAIVGSTGAGKTTLIKLLSRLYDITEGSIKIDGHDIRDLDPVALRRQVATVPQDVFLFDGSVAENISSFDTTLPEEEIRRAAAELQADSFIERLPGGFHQGIMEEGRTLSAGERQLLSFTRAFVRQPQIIFLDEATSNIDSESERKVEEGTRRLMRGKTAIIIAHRLSTIKSVDRILVLHKGELAEEGSHEELLDKNGIYTKLYRMQSLALGERTAPAGN